MTTDNDQTFLFSSIRVTCATRARHCAARSAHVRLFSSTFVRTNDTLRHTFAIKRLSIATIRCLKFPAGNTRDEARNIFIFIFSFIFDRRFDRHLQNDDSNNLAQTPKSSRCRAKRFVFVDRSKKRRATYSFRETKVSSNRILFRN